MELLRPLVSINNDFLKSFHFLGSRCPLPAADGGRVGGRPAVPLCLICGFLGDGGRPAVLCGHPGSPLLNGAAVLKSSGPRQVPLV